MNDFTALWAGQQFLRFSIIRVHFHNSSRNCIYFDHLILLKASQPSWYYILIIKRLPWPISEVIKWSDTRYGTIHILPTYSIPKLCKHPSTNLQTSGYAFLHTNIYKCMCVLVQCVTWIRSFTGPRSRLQIISRIQCKMHEWICAYNMWWVLDVCIWYGYCKILLVSFLKL